MARIEPSYTSERSQNGIRSIMSDCSPDSLLHAVQMSRIFPDSKTFVDMTLKWKDLTVETVLKSFEALLVKSSKSPDWKKMLTKFVEDNFTLEDQLEKWEPKDWKPEPKFLQGIKDPKYRDFASALNHTWKVLARRQSPDVSADPSRFSLLPLPNPVVVPGGRFREVYYWDSFWIVRGLLLCEMGDTVRGMLANFVSLIEACDKIPNGGRSYYENRSQPPLFLLMVDEYVRATGDKKFIKENLETMTKEFDYWLREHFETVPGTEFKMARYISQDTVDGPRPESYFEDFELADKIAGKDADARAELYKEMKSGAESGWDYSTRWMITAKGKTGGLGDTKTSRIIPVDLNCYLHKNAALLSEFHESCGNKESAEKFAKIAADLAEAVSKVLWNEEDGIWYDYDMLNGEQRKAFFPSNLCPLWTGTLAAGKENTQKAKVTEYALGQNLDSFPGGVPTSLVKSGQQWDFPNCWPPLEHIVVQGLERTGIESAKQLAFRLAEKRVRGAFVNHKVTGHMFEKYDATSLEKVGGGGEYDIQIGFGWTNGVVLDFLNTYGSRMEAVGN